MSNRTLLVIAIVALVVLAGGAALLWFLGPQLGYGMMGGYGFGRGMMERGWMHPGMMGRWGGGAALGWPLLLFGVFRVLGWVAQIAIIAAIVAWLIKPRVAQPPAAPEAAAPPPPPAPRRSRKAG